MDGRIRIVQDTASFLVMFAWKMLKWTDAAQHTAPVSVWDSSTSGQRSSREQMALRRGRWSWHKSWTLAMKAVG